MSAVSLECCQPMTRKHYERRAGVRFGHLIRQLIDDGWTVRQIADAVGCDATLVTKWRYRGSSVPHDVTRKGINDQVIQGVLDGLHVRSDYLFMSPKGYSDKVRLRDGQERPCEPGELDHKLFKVVHLDEARTRRDVVEMKLRQDRQDLRQDATDAKLDRMNRALDLVAAALGIDLKEDDDDQRSTR